MIWKLLGDEVVLRSGEDGIEEIFTPANEDGPGPQGANVLKILVVMISVSGYCDCHLADDQGGRIPDSATLSPLGPTTPSTSPASPVVSGTNAESSGNGVPQQLMSLLSFGAAGGSRQQSQRRATAIIALMNVFSQLAFADSVMTARQSGLAIHVFQQLLKLLRTAQRARARLAILQAVMRLRADRDHRVYMKRDPAENEPHILTLASLIDRVRE